MFIKIEDHINLRTYLLDDIPVSYGPMHGYFFEKNSMGPIHLPYDGEVGRGRYCICHMVDMHFNKIPFTVMEPGDVIDIEKHIRFYLLSIAEMGDKLNVNKTQGEYIRRMSELYKDIKKSADRLIARNPETIFSPSKFTTLVQEANG